MCVYQLSSFLFFSLDFVQYQVHSIKERVDQAVADAQVESIPDLDSIFSDPLVLQPFSGLHTEYLQSKYFKEHLKLLVRANSTRISLNLDLKEFKYTTK